MRRSITISLVLFLCLQSVQSQTISPPNTDEFCPDVNIVFTVTVPGTNPNVVSWTGTPIVNQNVYNSSYNSGTGITTFNFQGRFRDVNVLQVFRITYAPGGSGSTNWDVPFVRVRSLFHQNPNPLSQSCPQFVQPNIGSITAAPCTIVNTAISFNKIKWFTYAENPEFCFGEINDYEYQLPSGWSIGANVSNGTNWIRGDNSETITSDLATTGNVKIRPGGCTAGAANGITPVIINISRPKPALTFTGGFTVCTSQNFQANNVPGWVTNYNWQVTPNTIFGNPNPTSNPTTVNNLFNGEGNIQLTISSPSCPASFVYNTQDITGQPKLVAGPPSIQASQPLMIYSGPGDENELCRNEEHIIDFTTGTGSTTTWSYVSHSGNPQPSWRPWGNEDLYVYFFKPTQNTIVFEMDVTNSCGTTSYQFGFIAIDCEGLMAASGNSFKISPNPARSSVSISPVKREKSKAISEIIIAGFHNNTLSRKKFINAQTAQLFIGNLKPGTYFITIVSSDGHRETQKLIKQ